MNTSADVWFVRLPTGRVLRAESTDAVRQYLGSGLIPSSSRVRRPAEENWVALERRTEFADLFAPRRTNGDATRVTATRPAGPGPSRPDVARSPGVGLRGMLHELLAALESTLVRGKLGVAAFACVLGGLVVAFLDAGLLDAVLPGPVVSSVAAGLAGVFLAAVAGALLTEMTYLQLARLRPASWGEAAAGLGRSLPRVFAGYLLIGGGAVLAIALLRAVPAWLGAAELSWSAAVREALTGVAVVLEVALWPVVAFALLLAPVAVVEECSLAGAFAQWAWLVRQQLPRLLLYEGLALLLGGVVALALALPLVLAAWAAGSGPAVGFVLRVLEGLALTPLVAYLAVANVFIYLNVRYGAVSQEP